MAEKMPALKKKKGGILWLYSVYTCRKKLLPMAPAKHVKYQYVSRFGIGVAFKVRLRISRLGIAERPKTKKQKDWSLKTPRLFGKLQFGKDNLQIRKNNNNNVTLLISGRWAKVEAGGTR
jgi:hypothetical protein